MCLASLYVVADHAFQSLIIVLPILQMPMSRYFTSPSNNFPVCLSLYIIRPSFPLHYEFKEGRLLLLILYLAAFASQIISNICLLFWPWYLTFSSNLPKSHPYPYYYLVFAFINSHKTRPSIQTSL